MSDSCIVNSEYEQINNKNIINCEITDDPEGCRREYNHEHKRYGLEHLCEHHNRQENCGHDGCHHEHNNESDEHRHTHDESNGHARHCQKHEHINEDGECGHGHNHGHNHEHNHEHIHDNDGCGHHHEHHHEHSDGKTYDVPGFASLETHSHEGATVCSFEKMVRADLEAGPVNKKIIEEKINALTEWLETEGAVIGHIKGYIKAPEENFTFSTTGSGINYGLHRAEKKKLAFAAIVIGVDEEGLKDKVVALFKNVE